MARSTLGAAVSFVRRVTVFLALVASGLAVPALSPTVEAAAAEVSASVSDGPLQRPDATSASALAAEVDQPVQVTDLITETSDTTAMPDGSFESRFFSDPVRVRRGSGWAEIDTTLRVNVDGSVFPATTVSELTFSGGGSGPAVRLAKAGRDLTLWWPGQPLPPPVVDGDTATYRDVMPGVDLQLRARPDGFAQLLVVKDAVAAANPALRSIRWDLSVTGLSVQGDVDGRFTVADEATGEPVWFVPESFMWDSTAPVAAELADGLAGAGDQSIGLRTARVGVTADSASLTVVPDTAMLDDPGLVFPLYIDPELVAYSTGWTQVNACAPNTSYWSSLRDSMRVGLEYGTSSCVWRSMVRFNLGSITNQGQQILYAQFRTLLDHSASCSPASVDFWYTDWIDKGQAYTWNSTNSFGYSGFWNEYLVTAAGNANEASCAQPDMWMHFGGGGGRLRDIVQGSVNGACGCIAFGLKAAVENDTSKWKRFYPADSATVGLRTYLQITHDRPPAMPTVQPLSTTTDCYKACTSPAQVRTTTPALRVGVSDPESNAILSTMFEVRTAASDTATLVATNSAALVQTGDPGTAAWQVPSGKLVNNTTYYWRAVTRDELGLWGPWTAWQSVKVDISPPGISSVTSSQYPFKQWGAVVGTTGTFALTGPSDVNEFTWWVDSGASTTVTASGTTSKTASVSHTPTKDMVHTLSVRAKDIAGNTGTTYGHQFWVTPLANRCWNWRLDETSGTTAADKGNTDLNDPVCAPIGSSVTAMPGTLSGSVAFASGYVGNGASFSSTGGQVTTAGPVLDTRKSFTVMAWVRPSDLAAAGVQTVLSQDGSSASRFVLRFDQSANGGAGGWCFGMRASDSTATAPVSACADGSTWGVPTQGTWVHLAGVYDASISRIRVYVMGDPLSCGGEMTEVVVTGSWAAPGSFVIGRAKGSTSDNWRGGIDQVYAHQRVLSASEICQQAVQ